MAPYRMGDAVLCVGRYHPGDYRADGGRDPYPGLADVFFILYYVFLGLAVLIPSLEMRRNKEAQNALLIAGLTGAVGLVIIVFGLIEPALLDAGLSPLALALTIFYVVADVCLLVTPAIFVLWLVWQAGERGKLLPWSYISAGLIVMALADMGLVWMTAHGTYEGGAFIDYGWMIATTLLAVGGSLALDAATSRTTT